MKRQRILFLNSVPNFVLFVLMVSASLIGHQYTNKYMADTPTSGTVLRHVSSPGTNGNTNFYIVMSNRQYGEFDILVSAATWSKFKDGEHATFGLSEFDIRQNMWKNTVMIGSMILIWLTLIYLLLSVLYYTNPNDNLIVFIRSQLRGVHWSEAIKRFPNDGRYRPNSWPQESAAT